MKKKLINLLLVLCMAFAVIGFIGCDKDKGDDAQSSVESTLPPSSEQPPEKENFTGITFPDKTVTYNGNAHSLELVGVPTFATVNYDKETSYTNVGTYTVKATVTADNYNALELSATLKINKATYDMSGVTYENTTVTYDGQPHMITVGNLPDGVTASVEQKSCVNADSYDLLVTFTGDSTNYNSIDSVTKTLTIEKRELVLSFSGEHIVNEQGQWKELLTYNGEEQKTIDVEGTNIVSGDNVKITLIYNGAMVEKGDYIVTASIDEQNYKLTQNNTVQVKISRAVHTLTFKQEGFADVTLTVNNLEDITARIPTLQAVKGYDIVWVWGDNDYTCVTDSWTITAQKTAIPYTITYINNGVAVSNTEEYTVEDADILLNNPSSGKGITFVGWYDENDELIESIDTAAARNRTITAKWDTYRIEKATGFTIDYTPIIPTISITIANAETVLTLDDKITVSRGCVLELYIPTIADGNKQLTNDLFDLQIGNNEGYLVVRNAQLGRSLSYKLNVYRLDIKGYTFMNGESTHDSGTVEELSSPVLPETPTREVNGVAYTFVGWSVNGEIVEFPYTVTEDTVFTAEYTPTEYTVTLELAGGSLAETTLTYNFETATFDLPTTATRDYYTFAGWEYSGNPITQISQGSYGDKTITATWTAISYAITYEMNEGTNADNPVSYTVEDEIVLKTPTRDYYEFVEWQCNGQAVDKIPVGWHGDKTIVAIWTPTVYQITYEMNDGMNVNNPASYTIEDEIVLQAPTKEHYDFVEWQYEGEKIEKILVGSYGEKTFTAIWTPHIYTVSYDFDGGVEIEQPVTEVHIEQLPLSLNTQRTHKDNAVYDGWYLDEEFTIPATQLTEGKDTVIYVKWIQASQGLEYQGNILTNCYTGMSTEIIIAEWYNGVQITEIRSYAFEDCSTLTSVTIPDSITVIGTRAFLSCNSMKSIIVDARNTAYQSIDGNLYTKDEKTLLQYAIGKKATEFIIPDSVTLIEFSAFEDCKNLKSVVIPSTVTSLGRCAFQNCESLRSVEFSINSELTSIQYCAFYGCDSLISIEIPDGVVSIGADAFKWCDSLTSIVIPDSVTSIGDKAFYNCSRLTIYCEATNKPSGWDTNWNYSKCFVEWGYTGS